ncbi:MAG: hypothetical protein LBI87_05290 [Candidatus Accumulibacter sp.]|jgi:hypothetical protein|nr:hypothetical protein [Accumulibacter sp.]
MPQGTESKGGVMIRYITLPDGKLEDMLHQAARRGAEEALRRMSVYDLAGASKRLGMCENTLRKRIRDKKIIPVDGRITEIEILRYLGVVQQEPERMEVRA